jgi:hypothetical protein
MAFARPQDCRSCIQFRVYMERAVLSVRRTGPLLCVLSVLLSACDSTAPALSTGRPPDSIPAVPQDTLPVDSTSGPPTDSLVPPPDTAGPVDPPVAVVHVGIPFGPFALPRSRYGPEFTGAYRPPWADSAGVVTQLLLADLEAARRTNTQVLLNFTGPEHHFTDDAGFSLAQWKQRVDRFRGLDLTSYIADGTILGHFLMDEPSDPSNWNGTQVSPAEVDEMARYSKEIWPTMATMVRGWPAYLNGYHFEYLDAAWAQYHVRFGSIDEFIANNVRDAKASGLALVAGMNVLNGGSTSSGIPGTKAGKYAMSASELRSWGGALLSEPYMCALFIWRYDSRYFERPDIQAALSDLNHQAQSRPTQPCRRES